MDASLNLAPGAGGPTLDPNYNGGNAPKPGQIYTDAGWWDPNGQSNPDGTVQVAAASQTGYQQGEVTVDANGVRTMHLRGTITFGDGSTPPVHVPGGFIGGVIGGGIGYFSGSYASVGIATDVGLLPPGTPH